MQGVRGTERSPDLRARQEKLCFFKKSRKKTSGTLYSVFKEPDPRGAAPSDDAVPPAYLYRLGPKTELSVYGISVPSSTLFPRRAGTDADTRPPDGSLERSRTLAGKRTIGPRNPACQGISGNRKNAIGTGVLSLSKCTDSCAFLSSRVQPAENASDRLGIG